MVRQLTTWLIGRSDLVEPLVWLQRRETWYADLKTNTLRLLTLLVFTLAEFFGYHVLHAIDHTFHITTVMILLLWWTAAGLVQWAIVRHLFPRRLPYVIAGVDLFLLTGLLILGAGPRSSLIVIYFLIVAASGIRLNPTLSLYTATGACLGYLLVWLSTWGQGTLHNEFLLHATVVPVALVFMGIIMSNWIQRVLVILNDCMTETPSR